MIFSILASADCRKHPKVSHELDVRFPVIGYGRLNPEIVSMACTTIYQVEIIAFTTVYLVQMVADCQFETLSPLLMQIVHDHDMRD
jgi:hypothetical protein